jgi:putative protease
MPRLPELLAPGGDLDAIKAAVMAGADAVYCGLGSFNARARATNIGLEELGGILALAHRHGCRVFLTLNIVMVESDLPRVIGLLNALVNTSIDGVIVQDLGLLHLLSRYFPRLAVHASTQLTTHNEGQLGFLAGLGVCRVNLARELDLEEIRAMSAAAHRLEMATEVFVHGSYCLCFSGVCYLSSIHGFDSGNRGRCSQPCRARYQTTPVGVDHPLNLVDNAAYGSAAELWEAGVDALKIEGRIKKFPYVYTVTRAWRRQLERLRRRVPVHADSADLHAVFNRGFSDGFLRGELSRDMFSDSPRNQAAQRLSEGPSRGRDLPGVSPFDGAYGEIAEVAATARRAIEGIGIDKISLRIRVTGEAGAPLRVSLEGPALSFSVASEISLAPRRDSSGAPPLDAASLQRRFEAIGAGEYRLGSLETEGLQPGLFLPFGQLRRLQRRVRFVLNGARETIAPHEPRELAPSRPAPIASAPSLGVLIASERDLALAGGGEAELYFRLPNELRADLPGAVELLCRNRQLTPWFPAILIGEDHAAAVELLRRVRPARLVTDNTGVAHRAAEAGIPWIAGPQLNIANSHALRALRRSAACVGAFVSNELSRAQIERIAAPEGFALFYSIFHPMQLLTSRQCPFHQVSGCDKDCMDDDCLGGCERSASLTNMRGDGFVLHKIRGDYPALFLDRHFLNTSIVADIPGRFTGFLVDLRDTETQTRAPADKAASIALFGRLLRGQPEAAEELGRRIGPTTCELYRRGI